MKKFRDRKLEDIATAAIYLIEKIAAKDGYSMQIGLEQEFMIGLDDLPPDAPYQQPYVRCESFASAVGLAFTEYSLFRQKTASDKPTVERVYQESSTLPGHYEIVTAHTTPQRAVTRLNAVLAAVERATIEGMKAYTGEHTLTPQEIERLEATAQKHWVKRIDYTPERRMQTMCMDVNVSVHNQDGNLLHMAAPGHGGYGGTLENALFSIVQDNFLLLAPSEDAHRRYNIPVREACTTDPPASLKRCVKGTRYMEETLARIEVSAPSSDSNTALAVLVVVAGTLDSLRNPERPKPTNQKLPENLAESVRRFEENSYLPKLLDGLASEHIADLAERHDAGEITQSVMQEQATRVKDIGTRLRNAMLDKYKDRGELSRGA